MRQKFIFFIGTSAELIKLIPVISEFENSKIKYQIYSSGQTDLKQIELKEILEIRIDKQLLGKPQNKTSVKVFGFWVLNSFFNSLKVFKTLPKDSYIIVHGDTASSLVGSVSAKVSGLNIVHIESGLRSFNFFQPFPEEICRYVVSLLADYHFCPNEWSVNNLIHYPGEKINTENNTSLESLHKGLKLNKLTKEIENLKTPYFLFVLHRQENLLFKKEFSRRVIFAIHKFANSNLKCVFVMHKLTETFLKEQGIYNQIVKNKNIILLPRTPYLEFINTINRAEFLLTDGGSNQEEAYYLGKPTLILRNVTERIEGLGENVLLMKENFSVLNSFLKNYKQYKREEVPAPTTRPSKIILKHIKKSIINLQETDVEELKWDSDFFGYKVGKLDLQNSIDFDFNFLTEPYRLIYSFINPINSEASKKLIEIGGKFLDRKTEYKLNLSESEVKKIKNENLNFKFLSENDLNEELVSLSYEAGKNSRFKLDSNFVNNEFEKLYDVWLKKSLNKEIAFETIGMYQFEKLIGFITLSKKYDGANIGLISVHPEYQNKGIGSDLLNYCFDYLKNKNYDFLYVTTQGLSEQATNFYERNGFKLLNQTDIYHIWKN